MVGLRLGEWTFVSSALVSGWFVDGGRNYLNGKKLGSDLKMGFGSVGDDHLCLNKRRLKAPEYMDEAWSCCHEARLHLPFL